MPEYPVVLLPHDSMWSKVYADESQRLRDSLSSAITQIHHVGSTSIPHIRAKPIIDIAVESEVFPPDDGVLTVLGCLGYINRGEAGVTGRCWLTRGSPARFNLHWCPVGGAVAKAQLAFRDRLRSDRKLAREYEQIKIETAPGKTIESHEYAEAKSEFVSRVLGCDGGRADAPR